MADEVKAARTRVWKVLEGFCRRPIDEIVNEDGEVCSLRDIGVKRGSKLIATCTAAGNKYAWPGRVHAVIDATTCVVRWAKHEKVEFKEEAQVRFVRQHKLFLEWEMADELPDEGDRLRNERLESALKAQTDKWYYNSTDTNVVLTQEELDACHVDEELHINSWVLVDDTAYVPAPPLLHDESTPTAVPWRLAEHYDSDEPAKLPAQEGHWFLRLLSWLLVSATFGGGIAGAALLPHVKEHLTKMLLLVVVMIFVNIGRNVIDKNRQAKQHQLEAQRAAPAPAAQREQRSPARARRRGSR